MRSLYGRIFIAFFATLVVSLFSFVAIFFAFTGPRMNRNARSLGSAAAEIAAASLSSGGRDALQLYIRSLDTSFGGPHYLVDARGIDVLSGEDHSRLLGLARVGSGPPVTVDGKVLLVDANSDGRFRLIAQIAPPTVDVGVILPYLALLFVAIAGVCWLIAAAIASPVRRLAAVVDRFGAGDIGARIHLRRRDELGDLARAYNNMADRIGVLLAAERQLLQDLSHELRSPLTRLTVGIELSRTELDRNRSADRLQAETDRLTSLVASLIETTRAEGNLAKPEMAPLDLTAVVFELAGHHVEAARTRDVTIALDVAPGVTIYGNRELVRRAIDNVLQNALRHAPDRSQIEIRCNQHDDQTTVTVRDWGEGVPEEALERLGTPFFRVDGSRSEITGGIGLGLALARRAMHLHHGTLSAENASPGLRIILWFPAPRVSDADGEQHHEQVTSPGSTSGRLPLGRTSVRSLTLVPAVNDRHVTIKAHDLPPTRLCLAERRSASPARL